MCTARDAGATTECMHITTVWDQPKHFLYAWPIDEYDRKDHALLQATLSLATFFHTPYQNSRRNREILYTRWSYIIFTTVLDKALAPRETRHQTAVNNKQQKIKPDAPRLPAAILFPRYRRRFTLRSTRNGHACGVCIRATTTTKKQARRDGMAVQALLKPKPGSTGYFHREMLTRTPEGRRVDLITLTDCHGILVGTTRCLY